MPSQAELDDIEFGRVHTVQQQVRDAAELGHEVFYLHVVLLPPVLSAMHKALAEHGFRVQYAQGWSAPDGPGQRFRIVKQTVPAESAEINVPEAEILLRAWMTCRSCVGGDRASSYCTETAVRNEVMCSERRGLCGRWLPTESALAIGKLAAKLLRWYIKQNQSTTNTPKGQS